jgi:hypothetical protein
MKKFIISTILTFGIAAALPTGCLPDLNGASNAIHTAVVPS